MMQTVFGVAGGFRTTAEEEALSELRRSAENSLVTAKKTQRQATCRVIPAP